MQDENQDTLNEIALKVSEKIEPIFTESLLESNSQLEHLEGIEELISWYKKTEKDKEDNKILEKILEKTSNEILKYLPQEFADVCIENTKKYSKEKQRNVKFDINFQLEPIRSFVEFAINVNKIRKKAGRIVFEINSTVTIKEIEIFSEQEKESKISLGVISGTIQISIIEIPFMNIEKPVEIFNKETEIDLSEYYISVN
ncbi:hypothetical protein [Nitrosopumilus sp.]|uniref:hypothetical protein n=1 Tax=Nitrosopumilus sp. TaxID=2024843 RepID=UPI00292EE937|nr:hypothetical protein [Nitrosopumilus sp.]